MAVLAAAQAHKKTAAPGAGDFRCDRDDAIQLGDAPLTPVSAG
jgi:hypothetical protein